MNDLFEMWSSSADEIKFLSPVKSSQSYNDTSKSKENSKKQRPKIVKQKQNIRQKKQGKIKKTIRQCDIDNLRQQIKNKIIQNSQEYDELQRLHSQQLLMLKQEHISQEQAATKSNEINFRNIVWSMTLNQGIFSEDLSTYFQKDLAEKQYACEKKLLELQQEYDEEDSQDQTNNASPISQITPQAMAEMIYNQLISPTSSESKNNALIDLMIERISKEDELLKVIPQVQKIKKSSHVRTTYPPSETSTNQFRNYPGNLFYQNIKLKEQLAEQSHYQKKFKKKIQKTDKFLDQIREEVWFGSAYPHFN